MRASLDAVRGDLEELRDVVMFEEWDEFVDSGDSVALPDVGPDDPAQIQYTSGTTGFPKGALLRHGALTDNAALFAREAEIGAGDVYVNPMPMFHTAGCVLGALGALHARAVHVPVIAFDPGFVLELIERERGTALLGVPTMQIALLEHPDVAIARPVEPAVVGVGRQPRPGRARPAHRVHLRRPVLHRVRHDRVLAARHDDTLRRHARGQGHDDRSGDARRPR